MIPVVGFDPSLRNWGIAKALLCPKTLQIHLQEVSVICPNQLTGKQVRQNSKDIEAAKQLTEGAINALQGAKAIFVEVPVGSQSARAMASYGVCVGVLGALRSSGIPFFELTPTEIKLAGAGTKNASKQDMIKWAIQAHPAANWPRYTKLGEELISEAKAEHMADAVAAIHAGIRCSAFQQVLPFLPT